MHLLKKAVNWLDDYGISGVILLAFHKKKLRQCHSLRKNARSFDLMKKKKSLPYASFGEFEFQNHSRLPNADFYTRCKSQTESQKSLNISLQGFLFKKNSAVLK